MKATVESFDAHRGVATVRCDNNLRIDVAWRVIRRAGFVPERGMRIEIQMDHGAVRKMRRPAVPNKTSQ
jgi:hypothetical protein